MVEVDFVAPRHLAGGGDPAWITVPLHHACGWSYGQDPLMPRVVLTSPDQKARLRLDPDPDPDGQWWTLHHAPAPGSPAWYASFGARTPVEVIGAFLDTQRLPTLNPRLVIRVRREVTAEQAAFALEERVRALGARRPALPTSPGVQPGPTGTGRTR